MADVNGRMAKIRNGLTPGEWGRTGAMAATIVGLNVVGWGMLAAALGGHYQISKTTVFGVGTGALAYTLGMRPLTSAIVTSLPLRCAESTSSCNNVAITHSR